MSSPRAIVLLVLSSLFFGGGHLPWPTSTVARVLAQQRTGAVPATRSTTQIATATGPAVVTIVARDVDGTELGQGSGFIVRNNGVIVTNWHVLDGAAAATVTLKTGEVFSRVSFIDGDEDADIAVIKIPGFQLPTVQVASSIPPVGARIVTVGSPLGLNGTVSEGIVSAIRVADGRQLVQITAPISPGSSGGPVLDSTGAAFAISTMVLDGGQQLNFAVPVKYAMGFLGGSTTERPLASVFQGRPTTTRAAAEPAAARAKPKPKPTARPLASLEGAYLLTFKTGALGLLVAANDTTGLFAAFGKQATVTGMQTVRTNASGEVALAFAGIASGGYQTDDGFWASGTIAQDDGKPGTPFEYTAVRFTPQLSSNNGVYRVHVRTDYRNGAFRGDMTDWQGTAAIITLEGRIYIDLLLKNSVGGTTGIYADGPLDSTGGFRLAANGTRLEGSVQAGAITAQWTDVRDGGATYSGRLSGERR